ncbi:MAG: class I SAM-dependent methyltransferase [Pseudomonadota bacterium]
MFKRLFSAKPRPGKRIAEMYRKSLGKTQYTSLDGARLVGFEGKDGFDYETYVALQNEANALKLDNQWVSEEQVANLAKIVLKFRSAPNFGLCHGTRQGYEQAWFRANLPGCDVIGTDIAESATNFENTVQWDFHEPNPDWAGRADFVYSNSWDHAFDPERAFASWFEALVPGGVILLDHSKSHQPDRANEMDPFGATLEGLGRLFERVFEGQGKVQPVEPGVMDTVATFVFQKT